MFTYFFLLLILPSLFCSPLPTSVSLADVFCRGPSLFLYIHFAEPDILFLGQLRKPHFVHGERPVMPISFNLQFCNTDSKHTEMLQKYHVHLREHVHDSISSRLLSTTKALPSPSYDRAYFRVSFPCCLSHHTIKNTQISLLHHRSCLQLPAMLCKAKLHITVAETLHFGPVSPSLLRPRGSSSTLSQSLWRMSAFSISIFNIQAPFSFCLRWKKPRLIQRYWQVTRVILVPLSTVSTSA